MGWIISYLVSIRPGDPQGNEGRRGIIREQSAPGFWILDLREEALGDGRTLASLRICIDEELLTLL